MGHTGTGPHGSSNDGIINTTFDDLVLELPTLNNGKIFYAKIWARSLGRFCIDVPDEYIFKRYDELMDAIDKRLNEG